MSKIIDQQIGKLRCAGIITSTSSVCYILTPMPMEQGRINALADKYATSIVVIEGMSWDHDLTPWPSPAVMRGDSDFKGLAPEFLPKVLEAVKTIEQENDLAITERTLVGISLSGLFALWAWTQTDVFTNIGTLSGSYWYEGFVQWFASQSKPCSGNIYLAVGDKEHESRNPYFARIEDNTATVAEILQHNNNNVIFERVPGTHYASVWPRLEGLFEGLNKLNNK